MPRRLSIFNAFDYGTAHWSLTYTFGGCCLTSAVLQTTEVYRISTWLGRGPQARSASFSMTAAQEEAAVRTRRSLRRIALAKAVVLGACLLAGVGFAVTYGLENTLCNNAADFLGEGPNGWRCNLDGSFSAACEWVSRRDPATFSRSVVLLLHTADLNTDTCRSSRS